MELAETIDDLDNTANGNRANNEHKERLEASAAEAEVSLFQRRAVKGDTEAITAWARDMTEFLKESELPGRRTFIDASVKEFVISPSKAVVRY